MVDKFRCPIRGEFFPIASLERERIEYVNFILNHYEKIRPETNEHEAIKREILLKVRAIIDKEKEQ